MHDPLPRKRQVRSIRCVSPRSGGRCHRQPIRVDCILGSCSWCQARDCCAKTAVVSETVSAREGALSCTWLKSPRVQRSLHETPSAAANVEREVGIFRCWRPIRTLQLRWCVGVHVYGERLLAENVRAKQFMDAPRGAARELMLHEIRQTSWQSAPKARITSGGRFHTESCRLIR